MRRLLAILAIGVLAACGGGTGSESSSGGDGAASTTAGAPGEGTGGPIVLDDQGGGAGEQLCATYSPAQIGDFLGVDVRAGEVVFPLESGCQWDAKVGTASLAIQMTLPDFYTPPREDPEFTPIEGLGDEAYTAPGLFDDATAALVVDDRFHILVSVDGLGDEGYAVALEVLRDVFERQGDAPGQSPASGGAIPPLPDPAPALPCDENRVLCVDASGGPSALQDALAAAGDGAVVQVAAGTYEVSLELTGVSDLRLVGGFPAGGDFSERDAAANETVLQGSGDGAVVDIVDSTGVHIEGFRITGGGGHYDGYNYAGGGVYVDQTASDVAIVGNRIDGNAVDRGDDPGYAIGGGIARVRHGRHDRRAT